MYVRGSGVPKDNHKASEWIGKSAEQGHERAQLLLSAAYYEGRGLPKDFLKARMWLEISGYALLPGGRQLRTALEQSMTPEQIEQAQQMAAEWLEAHPEEEDDALFP